MPKFDGDTIRLVVIGCGRQMLGNLLPSLRLIPKVQVVACIDPDPTARLKAADIVSGICISDISDQDWSVVDGAILALPPNISYGVASTLLQQRVPCFIEKPPATDSASIAKLAALSENFAIPVQIGFNFRFSQAVREIYNSLKTCNPQRSVLRIRFRSRHPQSLEHGSSSLAESWVRNNGIHALDLALWLQGDVLSVSTALLNHDVDRFLLVAILRHSNGSVSMIEAGNIANSFDIQISIDTPNGDTLFMPHLGEVIQERSQGLTSGMILYRTKNLDNGWTRSGYGPELMAFIDAIQNKSVVSPSLDDALRASRICDTLVKNDNFTPNFSEISNIELEKGMSQIG